MNAWDDLVTAATIGTDSQPVETANLPDDLRAIAEHLETTTPAAKLLDIAALYTVAHRAGHTTEEAPPLREPAKPDSLPEISAAATTIVNGIIDGNREDLLADVLQEIAAAGYRAPAATLPTFLTAGTRSIALRQPILTVLGNRGKWLAAQNNDWRWVGRTDIPEDVSNDPAIWETGTASERIGWFAQARRNSPDEARELLTTGWASETPEARESLIGLLQPELSPADEPFLETALADRRAAVRTGARDLLAQLPDSQWQQRMRDRAAKALTVERKLLRRKLIVELPEECGASMVRDGIVKAVPKYQKIGEKTFWLRQIIAAAPLSMWADAAETWDLKATDAAGTDYTADIRIALFEATVQQRNVEWAMVILASDYPPLRPMRPEAKLLALLSIPDQFDVITGLVLQSGLAALTWISDLRQPWPPKLAEAVMYAIRTAVKRPAREDWNNPDAGARFVVGRHLPATVAHDGPDYLWQLNDTLAKIPPESRWNKHLMDIIDTVALRRRLLEELK